MDTLGQQKIPYLITSILCFFKYKAEASREDNYNWSESTTGPFAKKYWKATKTKIETLESMGAWDIVKWDGNINSIHRNRISRLRDNQKS